MSVLGDPCLSGQYRRDCAKLLLSATMMQDVLAAASEASMFWAQTPILRAVAQVGALCFHPAAGRVLAWRNDWKQACCSSVAPTHLHDWHGSGGLEVA